MRIPFLPRDERTDSHPNVMATMVRPDHSMASLPLFESAIGEFETSTVATQVGVYRFLVQARGLSTRGHRFTRDQLVSAVIGDQPPRDPPPADGTREILCKLLTCLTGRDVMTINSPSVLNVQV